MFSLHPSPQEFENATITGHFEFVFDANSVTGKSHDYRDVIVSEKLRFQNVFHSHENEKLAFSNSSGLKSVFDKDHFRDGLVWTVGLTVEIKLCFQISQASTERGLRQQFAGERSFENATFDDICSKFSSVQKSRNSSAVVTYRLNLSSISVEQPLLLLNVMTERRRLISTSVVPPDSNN